MYEPHEPTLVGGPLRDAANPADNVKPAACTICGTRDNIRRILTAVDGILCDRCFHTVMHLIGTPTVPGNAPMCSAPHPADLTQTAYGVTQQWPPHTYLSEGEPTIRACRAHLVQAIEACAAHTTSEAS